MQVVLKHHYKNLVWCSVISRIQRQLFSFYLSKRLKKLFSGFFSKIGFLATFFLFLPLMEFFHFWHNSDQKIFNPKNNSMKVRQFCYRLLRENFLYSKRLLQKGFIINNFLSQNTSKLRVGPILNKN